jgi:hypothetical protein
MKQKIEKFSLNSNLVLNVVIDGTIFTQKRLMSLIE